MIIFFDPQAFEDFKSWSIEDKKVFAKIGDLKKGITRDPLRGIGKPETLKHELFGWFSVVAACICCGSPSHVPRTP